MADADFVKREDLHQVDDRLSAEIRNNRERIGRNSEDISELRAMYMSVSELPKTISSLEKTIVSVCNNLDNMDASIKQMNKSILDLKKENSAQNDRISEVDDKSKIDWTKFITENFWKILVLAGGIYYVVKDILSSGIG